MHITFFCCIEHICLKKNEKKMIYMHHKCGTLVARNVKNLEDYQQCRREYKMKPLTKDQVKSLHYLIRLHTVKDNVQRASA